MILDLTTARIGDLVAPRQSFMPSIDLDRAHDPDYRRLCRDEYIYLPEDEVFFKNLANALLGQLAGGRRTIFEVGAYGAGKSLLDAVRGHLLADPADRVLLEKLRRHAFLYERFEQLVAEGPYLPVFIVGSQAAGAPIDAVVTEAIARALPPGLSLVSDHERALEWLDGLAERGELLGEFRDALPSAQPAPPKGGGWSLDSLRLGLEGHHPAALIAFRHAQAQAIRWPTAAFGASRAVEILQELHVAHVGPNRRYAGIILFFDEFSQWVDMLPEGERAGSIASVQGLVEWVNHSPRVAMIMSSQVRPVIGESYNALETLLTRTQEVAFDRQSYTSFLAHVLERGADGFEPLDSQTAWPALEAAHTKLFGSGPGAGPRDYYPFHPGAVRALATLADLLGARERSVAQLLGADADEEGGFGAFLRAPVFESDGDARRLRLFTLDRLFPYFAIRIREDHPQLYGRYEEIVAGDGAVESLRTRIARVIVLSDLLGPAFPVQPTSDGISGLLHLPTDGTAVSKALEELVADGLVMDAGDRGYRVASAGRISKTRLDREIERRIHELSSSGDAASSGELARRVQQAEGWASEIWRRRHVRPATPAIAQSGLEAADFAAEFRVNIEVAVQRITLIQLADVARRVGDGRGSRTPTIYVVLSSDADADAEALTEAANQAQAIAAAGFAVGLPRRPARVADLMIRVTAIERLGAEDAFAADELVGQALLTAREALLKDLVTELNPADLLWFLPDEGGEPLALPGLSAAADRLVRVLASHLPRGLRTDIGTDVKQEVASILLLAGEIRLALDRTHKKPHQILHDGLAGIGVLEVEHRPADPYRIARIVAPDREAHPYTREIWDLLLDAVEGRRTLAAVVDTLGRPPFMLPRNLGAYLLAAVLGYTRAHVVVDGGHPQRPEADLMRRLWDDPSRYRFVAVRGLSRDQAAAAREVAAIVASETPLTMRKALEQSEPDEGMLVAIGMGAARWHERVGRKASELAETLGIAWPPPLADWLTLAPQLAGVEPAAMAERLISLSTPADVEGDGTNPLQLAAIQADALRDVLAEREVLLEAAQSTDASVAEAWAAFAGDPLAEDSRAQVRAAMAEVSSLASDDDSRPAPDESPTTFATRVLSSGDLRRLATEVRLLVKAGEPLTGAELVRRLAAALGLDETES